MATTDYYPRKREELPEWYQNFEDQLNALAAKYGITPGQLAEIIADSAWFQYWVAAMFAIEQQVDALTGKDGYFETILAAAEGTPPPSAPVIALPAGAPAQVPPGARDRVREIARFIKGNPVYVVSDGELLGIVSAKETPSAPSLLTADFSPRTLAGFAVEVTFSRQGMTAMRFEFRHKGGNWIFINVLPSSPGTLVITPETPGVAEQIELRSILMDKNDPVGNYSDTKNAFIAP